MTNAAKKAFRPDIEGLRAVAVLLVLVFHAGLPLTGGYVGVDIFFVISGFLITSLLLREAETTGRVSLLDFYARRAKRLLPAATAAMLVTLVLVWRFSPVTQRADFAIDVIAAAGYFVNWRFADRSIDYLAEDLGRSPVLHFWSLSVEEQFYFLWPLLIIASLSVALRTGKNLRPVVASSLALVMLPSFAWAIYFTAQGSTEAFFVSTTRLWELGVGATLALALPHLATVSYGLGRWFSLGGLGLVAFSALYFDAKSPWPSYLALGPTVGTALLIAGGTVAKDTVVTHVLGSKPMVWIGGLSYSLYLWHWPLVVVGQDWMDLRGPIWGSALVVGSVVPAWLSYRFIETPVRFAPSFQWPSLATVSLGLNLSMGVALFGAGLATFARKDVTPSSGASVELSVQRGAVLASPSNTGAGALGKNPRKSHKGKPRNNYREMRPPPSGAKKDIPNAYALGCQARFTDVTSEWCPIGDPNGEKRVFVLGDSKILQYYDALDAAGRALGFKMLVATKSSCAFSLAQTTRDGKPYTECEVFNEMVLREIQKSPPFAVITSQYASGDLPENSKKNSGAGMEQGLVNAWSRIRKLGTEVVVFLDNPRPPESITPVYECVLKHPDAHKKCSFDRKKAIGASAALVQQRAAAAVPGVQVIDLADYFCPQKMCAPVIGDVLIYRQGSHITNTYARTLGPVITQELKRVLSPKRE